MRSKSKSSVSGFAAAKFHPLFWEFGLAPSGILTGMDMLTCSIEQKIHEWFGVQ